MPGKKNMSPKKIQKKKNNTTSTVLKEMPETTKGTKIKPYDHLNFCANIGKMI